MDNSPNFQVLVITMLRLIIRMMYIKQFTDVSMHVIQDTIFEANHFLEENRWRGSE